MFSSLQAIIFAQHNHLVEAADVHTVHAQGLNFLDKTFVNISIVHAQGAGQVLKAAVARDHRGFRHPRLRPGRVFSWKSKVVPF